MNLAFRTNTVFLILLTAIVFFLFRSLSQDEQGLIFFLAVVFIIFMFHIGSLTSQNTKQQLTIESLRESVRQSPNYSSAILESLMSLIPLGILFINAEGKIELFSPKWLEWLGKIQEELNLKDFKAHSDVFRGLNQALKNQKSSELVWRDKERYYQLYITPIRSEKTFLGILVTATDISSYKNYEKIQSDFIADLSHELNTPVASVIGATNILKNNGAKLSKTEYQDFLSIIEKESARIARLLNELLELKKFGSGYHTLLKQSVRLRPLVAECFAAFKTPIEEKKLDVQLEIAPDLVVHVDEDKFRQIFLNLLSNSIRYTNEGSISVVATQQDECVAITFSDTGMGIEPENLDRIFDRFFRTDYARTRIAGGSGLGLSITREIIKRHQGTIDVKSTVGVGTTFYITIPNQKS